VNKHFSLFLFFLFLGVSSACERASSVNEESLAAIPLRYAKGFTISQGSDFWEIEVVQPWTGSDRKFRYLILQPDATRPAGDFDAVVQLPIEEAILTSTTQIPHLDMLGEMDKLIGFPQVDLISSPRAWEQIQAGKVQDLGSGPSANPEMILDLAPDLVLISTLGEDLRYLEVLSQAKIPALINGEYVEQHPLGRAEWIKFTGILFGKYEVAEQAFQTIEQAYLNAQKLANSIPEDARPTALSGLMYQDTWYTPGGESWGAQILRNAGGRYVFANQKGTGSLQLNYEFVLENALEADFWIGSADFSSLEAMANAEPRYRAFQAFRSGNVFTYTLKKGPKGGLEYFELGYMRPDLILKDLIKILHPDLLPEYELYFYSRLHAKD
jgi:iron complex transport system substrate-binding protein